MENDNQMVIGHQPRGWWTVQWNIGWMDQLSYDQSLYNPIVLWSGDQ